MFTQFNRQGHRQLSEAISLELADLGKRYGLTFGVGGGTIGVGELVIKVTATTADSTAIEQRAKMAIDVHGRYFGLKGDDFGAIFTVQGKRFKFTGVQPSRPKYPLNGECLSTGKTFKFTESVARQIIAARPASSAPAPSSPVHRQAA